MSETKPEAAQAPPSAAPAGVRIPRFPSLEPVTEGSAVIEYWGGFGAPCPECGFLFVEPTPEKAAEAATTRLTHGSAYCKERAARLSPAEKERLEKLWWGTTAKEVRKAASARAEGPKAQGGPVAKKGAAAKGPQKKGKVKP